MTAAKPSLTGKNWIIPADRPASMSISSTLAAKRNIDLSKVHSWSNLSDPWTLGDMQKAVTRIHHAIKQKESIGIIGDYDADGITGVAQLVRYFRRCGVEPHPILPHRERHGYGIKRAFIDALHEKKVTLILTVDTGISHADDIAYAKSIGIDVIITDHHEPRATIPDAIIVHPTVRSEHVNPNLSGSGVAFTLIRALEGDDWNGKEEDIALAAIGTVADIVALTGENRTIVQLGLEAMNTGGSAPVFQLAKSVRRKDAPITSTDIGFRIAPRINAAGRIADPNIALQALLSGGVPLERLQFLNEERKEATIRMMEIAGEITDEDASICIAKSGAFHPGIIGLIAGRMTENHGKPSIVCSETGGSVTCSLRSIPSYNIAKALGRCAEHLQSFGGHPMAGGCTLKKNCWDQFTESLLADAKERLDEESLMPTLLIDLCIGESDLTLESVKALQTLEPFGAENPEPRFLLQNQKLQWVKCVGKDGAHLQCQVGRTKAIGFRLGHLSEELPERADIVCRLGIDTWKGNERVQLFVEDIAAVKKAVVTA